MSRTVDQIRLRESVSPIQITESQEQNPPEALREAAVTLLNLCRGYGNWDFPVTLEVMEIAGGKKLFEPLIVKAYLIGENGGPYRIAVGFISLFID